MSKETVIIKVVPWLGERLDLLAYAQDKQKGQVIEDILTAYFEELKSEGVFL